MEMKKTVMIVKKKTVCVRLYEGLMRGIKDEGYKRRGGVMNNMV